MFSADYTLRIGEQTMPVRIQKLNDGNQLQIEPQEEFEGQTRMNLKLGSQLKHGARGDFESTNPRFPFTKATLTATFVVSRVKEGDRIEKINLFVTEAFRNGKKAPSSASLTPDFQWTICAALPDIEE